MMRCNLIILLFIVFILTGCKNSKSIFSDHVQTYAWSGDSAHGYYLMLTDKRFLYRLVTIYKDKEKIEKEYTGTYTYFTDRYDIGKYSFKYKKGLQPSGYENYLIQEGSGDYLIQPFTNGQKRMFLKIRRAIDQR